MGLEKYCGSPFWDHQLTVNTSSPDLTQCFQNTLLVWIPCGYMFLLTPFYLLYLSHSKRSYIPHNWLNITKTVLGCLIGVVCILDICVQVYEHSQDIALYPLTILAPAFRFLATTLAVSLIQFGRKKGVRSTGILFIYWVLHAVASVFILTSRVKQVIDQGGSSAVYYLSSYVVFTVLVVAELVLSSLVDSLPAFLQISDNKRVCPEGSASFLSEITYWWFTSLIVRGYKKSLERSDLWSLNEWDTSKCIVPQFDKQWQIELEKNHRSQAIHASKQTVRLRSAASADNGTVDNNDVQLKPLREEGEKGETKVPPVEVKAPREVYQPSLSLALVKAYGVTFLTGSLLKLIHDSLMFISPQLLKLIIQFISSPDDPMWHGYMFASLMFIVAFIQSMILHQYFHRCFLVGMRIRTSLIAAVYQKSLMLSNKARKTTTVGEIVNLMSVDAQRFMELTTYLNMIWSAPFQMCVCMYFLWQTLGPSVLAGMGVLILLIPVNAFIAKENKKLQVQQMKHKDARIKLMNEILNGIKVLKLYAWELSFQKKVLGIRAKELKVLRRAAYLNAASSFTWTCAPFLVSLTTFAVYVMSSPDNILDAEKAFVSLSLFNILRFPISMLPMLIANMVQASVSVKRLQRFLKNEELDPDNVTISEKTGENTAISIENGTFTWEGTSPSDDDDDAEDKNTLKNINIEIKEGSLIAVVGQVGMGKSSLLAAMLGEMEKVSGQVKVKGSVAYVAQQAWIQNATLKENILFGSGEKEKIYDQVLECCALKPDLEILPGGDMTEIGEKGINLSGGQKQRVSLARAVFCDTSVYLLDDPLSAVDSHVGKHIFDNVIGPEGLLKGKTRVLVTHGLSYLPQMDQILVVVDGRISEVGTYKELVAQRGAFADFLRIYMTEHADEMEDLPDEEYEFREEILSDIGSAEDVTAVVDRPKRIRTEVVGSAHNTPSLHRRRRCDTATSTHSHTGLNGTLSKSRSSLVSFAEREKELIEKAIKEKEERDKEKLIQAEKSETGSVKLKVFVAYISSVGYLISLAIIILYTLNNAAQVGANFWLSVWADENENAAVNTTMGHSRRDMYLGVYGALGLAQVIGVITLYLVFVRGTISAAALLHSNLLSNILQVPLVFMDQTPTGRVINRFSQDIHTLESLLSESIDEFLWSLMDALATVVVVGLSTPVFIAGLMPLMLCYFLVQIYLNMILRRCSSISTFYNIIYTLGVLSFGCFVVIAAIFQAHAALLASTTLHLNLLTNSLKSPMLFFDITPTGRIMNRFTKDTDTIDATIPSTLRFWLIVVGKFITALIVISYSTPWFLLVSVPLGVFYVFIQRFYVATSRQLKRLESVSRSPIYSHFGETIQGATTIRAYRQQGRFLQESESRVDENQVCYYPSIVANRWLAVRLEFVGNCIVLFAAFFAVLGKDHLSAGIVGLSISYALNITQTLNWMVRMTSELETNIVAVERVKEYSETPTEAEWEIKEKKPDSKWPHEGRVSFDHYSTRYRKGLDLVLKEITFDIQGGEKVGIVGRTGAGKSSLTLALFRIIEAASGSIAIDGLKIEELGLHDLRSKLTIIPQDPVLFSGPLRMNLDPFEAHTDDQIWTALEHAHLKAFVSGLTEGLEYECTEGGDNLSVGQRQLVCLARALLRKTRVLILDEATAAVDLETDDLIQSTIRTEFKECTVLTIAHRLNTIMDYNRILVLDQGKIAEFDSPEALSADKCSIFYGMLVDAGLIQGDGGPRKPSMVGLPQAVQRLRDSPE